MDIKETKELLIAVEKVAVTGVKIAKNGIELKDAVEVLELAKDYKVLWDGIEGSEIALKELKDIDEAELKELGVILYGLVKALKEAKNG